MRVLAFSIIGAIGLCAIFLLTVMIDREHQLYLDESKCVAKHISLGFERAEINTEAGICWVELE